MYLNAPGALLGCEEVAMRTYIDKVVAAIRGEQRRRAVQVPRRELPRRSRATFVAATHDVALAH
jgi:hypothetical protein